MRGDPYEILGVAADATGEDVKAAFRRLAMDTHPDRNPGDAAAEARFKDVNAAYQILGDEEKRAAWDRGERDEATPPGASATGVPGIDDPDVAAILNFAQEVGPEIVETLKAADTGEPIGARVARAGKNLGRLVAAKAKTPDGQAELRGVARFLWDGLLAFDRGS